MDGITSVSGLDGEASERHAASNGYPSFCAGLWRSQCGKNGIVISKMDAGYVRFSLGAFSNAAVVDKALEAANTYYSEHIMG